MAVLLLQALGQAVVSTACLLPPQPPWSYISDDPVTYTCPRAVWALRGGVPRGAIVAAP